MNAAAFFVLHDVIANTYSRDLISNKNKLENLHHLFKVRPRWYNRSKTTCDHTNIMMIRFKHAMPRTKYQMVPLAETNRKVRQAVKCIRAAVLRGGKGSSSLGTAAKVAAGVTAGLSTALVASGAAFAAFQMRAFKKKQQELNDKCLKKLKEKIGNQSTNTNPTIRQACDGKYGTEGLKKGNKLGQGQYGEVFSVLGNDKIVIKEQKALCYTFINEIECLQLLADSDIAPMLYDAYVCFDTTKTDIKNSEVTYGFVMDKLEESFIDYIKTINTFFDTSKNEIASQLLHILTTLDKKNIEHRDLHLGNFMIQSKKPLKIKIIDFGLATYNGKSEENYLTFNKQPPASNVTTFIFHNRLQLVSQQYTPDLAAKISQLLDLLVKHTENG